MLSVKLRVYVHILLALAVRLCSTAVVVEVLLGQLAEPSLRSICASEAGM